MNGWNDWDRVVIDGLAHLVDLHSLHIYTGSDDYWTNVLQPHQAERAIRLRPGADPAGGLRRKIARPPRIAYDEWNVWYRTDDGTLEERYNFTRRAGRGHLPEHLRPELPTGSGWPTWPRW